MKNEEKDIRGILQGMFAGADLSGAQIIAYNDGVVNYNAYDGERKKRTSPETLSLPAELSTPKATKILDALRREGIVDDGFGVCDGSLSKQAIVAEEVSRKVFIGEDIHWALFEQMWGVKNLRCKDKNLNKEYRAKVREAIMVGTGKIKI